jgi:hypothetical protein
LTQLPTRALADVYKRILAQGEYRRMICNTSGGQQSNARLLPAIVRSRQLGGFNPLDVGDDLLDGEAYDDPDA